MALSVDGPLQNGSQVVLRRHNGKPEPFNQWRWDGSGMLTFLGGSLFYININVISCVTYQLSAFLYIQTQTHSLFLSLSLSIYIYLPLSIYLYIDIDTHTHTLAIGDGWNNICSLSIRQTDR